MICAECGKVVPAGKAKGSMRHPYCAECFTKVWHDDFDAYRSWLEKAHC